MTEPLMTEREWIALSLAPRYDAHVVAWQDRGLARQSETIWSVYQHGRECDPGFYRAPPEPEPTAEALAAAPAKLWDALTGSLTQSECIEASGVPYSHMRKILHGWLEDGSVEFYQGIYRRRS